jgi:multidrug efflux system membrane fusion protein
VDNSVDPATGMITLKATFDNADHALWPGQFVEVELRLGVDRGSVVVPSSAVQNGQGGAQVFVVRADRTVEVRPVKVLRLAGDATLIAEGVRSGETVVTDGQLRLVPGATVESTTLAAAAAAGEKTAGTSP